MTAIEHESYRIDPLGARDIEQFDELAAEVFKLLSDENTLVFLPEKKLDSLDAARNWLRVAMLNFHSGRNKVHLIRSTITDALIGVIDLIPPVVAKDHYRLSDYPFFLEFYLKSSAHGKALMSGLLPKVIVRLRKQGVTKLAAVVNKKNLAASKVLKRSGFRLEQMFDDVQDLYRY